MYNCDVKYDYFKYYRAAEMGDDVVVRMRLPRYIHPEKVGNKENSDAILCNIDILPNLQHKDSINRKIKGKK